MVAAICCVHAAESWPGIPIVRGDFAVPSGATSDVSVAQSESVSCVCKPYAEGEDAQRGRRSPEIGRASQPGRLATQRLEIETDQAIPRLHRAREFFASLWVDRLRASLGVEPRAQRELISAMTWDRASPFLQADSLEGSRARRAEVRQQQPKSCGTKLLGMHSETRSLLIYRRQDAK